jgi:hypothetical protein
MGYAIQSFGNSEKIPKTNFYHTKIYLKKSRSRKKEPAKCLLQNRFNHSQAKANAFWRLTPNSHFQYFQNAAWRAPKKRVYSH